MEHVKAKRTQGNTDFPSDGVFCVYRLEDDFRNVFYVGQTRNLRERVYQHMTQGKKVRTVSFDVVEEGALNNLEARLIFTTRPKQNRSLPENDFYKSKASIKNELIKMVSRLVDDSVSDFEVDGAKRMNKKYLSTWKTLVMKECIAEEIKVILNSIK